MIEVIHEYVKDGRIEVSQLDDLGTVTLHDPCNLGRAGGIFEEPREIINTVVTDFQDMVPNREYNYCCGGGLVANLDEEERRLAAGKVKADQIRATDARLVITSCDNCRHQINELSEYYELGVEVIGVAELTVKAMQKAREAKKEAV